MTVAVYPDRLEIFCAGGLPEGMTMDLLMGKHGSVPRNPSLASVFYSAGYVESWGQGISKVREGCIANGNPEPEFREFCGGILAVITKPATSDLNKASGSSFVSNETDRKILKLISDNPQISASSISETIGVSMKTVQRHLSALRDSGFITRIGGDRGGYWKIMEDVDIQ